MFSFIFFTVAILVSLLLTCLWIWSLVDCVLREPAEGNDRIVWLIVLIFFNVFGTLVYLLYRRPQRIAELGR